MAVTRIWRIRGNASAPLAYVEDTEKTKNREAETAGDDKALSDVIDYASNMEKTDLQFYTTGINCNVTAAKNQFDTVKMRFGKEGGIVAGHCYQSFREGEVSAAEAHEIGVELARELWGDRFQVIVATHLNTKHFHNHFVFNSVSFCDGNRFHFCNEAYRNLRETSDRLCKEHGLSIIENPEGKRLNMNIYKMEQAGMPTRYNIARQAIDEAVSLSLNMEEFAGELKKRGYVCKLDPKHKYWSIVPPGWNKSIRTYRLGEEYTKDRIMERVYGNDPSVRTERIRQAYRTPNNYNLKRRIDKIMGRTGLEKLYLRYCYGLGYLPKYTQRPTRLHIVLKEDLLKCDLYSEEAKFLVRHNIKTDADLGSFVEGTKDIMEKLTGEREELRKKVKRNISEPDRDAAREKIKELTEKLKVCRKDLRLSGDIGERSKVMEKNLETVDRERTEVRERKGVKSI
jgi:hypothetical protein